MDKFDYFVAALKKGCAGRPHWMASVFSSMEHEVYDPGKHKLPPKDALNLIRENSKVYPYRIFRVAQDSKERCFINYGNEDDNPLIESIGEIEKMKPMLSFTDKIIIDEAIIPTAKAKIETCYGNLLVNWLLLFIPFGTKIDFLTGKLDGGMLDKIVNSKYSIEKKPAGERDNSFIYVDEYLIYQKNAAYLDNWASFSTASVSLKGLTPNLEVAKFFKEKLKEKGDKLTVTDLAIIEEEAAKLDKATFKGTEDGNFLTSKNINVGRKKMFYIYGLEEGFGLSTIVQAPLSEGVKAEDLPDYSNALRAASHNRGAQTALGGVGVKRANQIFQSIRIDSEDCGDKEGYSYIATDVRDLDGTYVFMKDGIRLITPDEAEQLLGREIKIRSPMRCKQGTPHYCAMCVGKDVAMLPHGVHNTIAAINSREMLIFMKAMHGRSLSTSEYDLKRSFY